MYLDTVASDTSIPSFSSSPWIRGAPQSGFSRLIRRTRSRTSRGTGARPPLRRRDFQVQNKRNPLRSHVMTVSGFTITSVARQAGQSRESNTQNRRSTEWSDGRDELRFIVASCWRNARTSNWSATRLRRVSRRVVRMRKVVVGMPEKVSRRSAERPRILCDTRFSGGTGHRDVYVPLHAAGDTVGDVRNVAADGVVAHRRSGLALACRRNVVHGGTICFPALGSPILRAGRP